MTLSVGAPGGSGFAALSALSRSMFSLASHNPCSCPQGFRASSTHPIRTGPMLIDAASPISCGTFSTFKSCLEGSQISSSFLSFDMRADSTLMVICIREKGKACTIFRLSCGGLQDCESNAFSSCEASSVLSHVEGVSGLVQPADRGERHSQERAVSGVTGWPLSRISRSEPFGCSWSWDGSFGGLVVLRMHMRHSPHVLRCCAQGNAGIRLPGIVPQA